MDAWEISLSNFLLKFLRKKAVLAFSILSAVLPLAVGAAERFEGDLARRIIDGGTILGASADGVFIWRLLVEYRGKMYGCQIRITGPNGPEAFCVSD